MGIVSQFDFDLVLTKALKSVDIWQEFKLYVIQELQRLKENESEIQNLQNNEWQSRRSLSKSNYRLQTHAVKTYILNGETFIQNARKGKEYANEADLLNEVVFQTTAKQFREQNPSLVQKRQNIRDIASTIELTVLANLLHWHIIHN